eukprot:scaffold36388_cov46-Attheya_sp.AAC.6
MDYCISCDREEDSDELGYGCCTKYVDGGFCERCYKKTKTKTCDKCKDDFCKVHGDMNKKRECCGMALCGSRYDPGCAKEHNPKKLKCGHTGCNYYAEKGCRACGVEENDKKEETAMLQDKKLVEELLMKSSSTSLKQSLSAWLQTFPKATTAAVASKKRKSGQWYK